MTILITSADQLPEVGSLAGLGRLAIPDENDKRFMLPQWLAEAENISHRYHMSIGPVLDQGGTSECVIYSGDKLLTTHPVCNKTFGSGPVRTRIYKEVQELDPWPGTDYDGTSVRAMMKWLQRKGLITRYEWAHSLEPAIAHLLAKGPLAMGTVWTVDMFMPDRYGYIYPGGKEAGGHAYLALGCNVKKKNPDGTVGAIQCLNSWGRNWGLNGRFWITFKDMEQLITQYGEAGTPTEIKNVEVIH